MTIQGAIAELQNLLKVDDVPFYYKGGIQKVIETIQMDIPKQADDLISRADAIKTIEELPNAYNGWSDAYDKAYIIETLEEVPSADRPSAVDLSSVYSTAYKSGYEKGKADRPQGEWIETSEGTMCSSCHKYPYDDGEYHIANWHSDYCPHCGARMKGADDE